jgi:hypothetical protein
METLAIEMQNGKTVIIVRIVQDNMIGYQVQYLDDNYEIEKVFRFARLSECFKDISKHYTINPRTSLAYKNFKRNGE